MPANSEDYVHRIGRTGRAGKTGHAISFANTAQKGSIRDIERFMKTKLAISTLPTLPSVKLLIKEADQLNLKNEPSRDEKPSKRKSSKDRSSNRPGSKRKVSKPKNSQSTDFNQSDSNNDNSFWSNFKKHRPSKKKSVGLGSKRKRRAKRK